MFPSIYQRATVFCATRITSAVFPTVSRVSGSTVVGSYPWQSMQQPQQVRSKWTKAKKKRFIRNKKNAARIARGNPPQRPPGYMDLQTPVENVISREEAAEMQRELDEKDKMELEKRRAALAAEEPLRHHMTGLVMNDRVKRLFDMVNGNQSEVVAYQKSSGMRLFQFREGDTGSTAVQVVALTSRIQQLQTHMRSHKKDMSTKRGLQKLIVRRRKLLDYLERKEFDSYRRVVKSLGLARS